MAISQIMPDQAKLDIARGLHVFANAYSVGTAYLVGDRITNSSNLYELTGALTGTGLGVTAPTGTTTSTDNGGTWTYKEAADVYKMALYTSSATLGSSTTTYSATNEVSGTGYTATGTTLTGLAIVIASNHANIDFADASWTTATITARGATIYNSTKNNRVVGVYDFGSDQTSTAGTFTVQIATGVISVQ